MVERQFSSVAEAREILGVSEPRMAQVLREGELRREPNRVDRRGKLVRRAEVQALAAKA